jgi:hypothetical protein
MEIYEYLNLVKKLIVDLLKFRGKMEFYAWICLLSHL